MHYIIKHIMAQQLSLKSMIALLLSKIHDRCVRRSITAR
jgi:hypothetical protein